MKNCKYNKIYTTCWICRIFRTCEYYCNIFNNKI